ncbi:Peptide methionine sulfoxide reductase MsrA 1 [Enhygromyxa salina]|uniref:Peptide methionine sulfoxide reductase MsrA n=1 Tax=Enhygromyxa salina TaxID=215803 RepID=A0A2S9YDX2_9BACT|nr:peptide-methionine (S)-S-oxide reductase MsrA [Enhygromyxa salina]PRQ03314.1 Peptide methionine sulfoxide reductase MsrA 1 [Enhygromyxa salina]
MRRLPLALPLLLLPLAACSSPANEGVATADPVTKQTSVAVDLSKPEPPIDTARLEAVGGVAYFAGGCFWGVEHFLEQIDGVLRVESGYMGGHVDDPSYAEVSSQESGHLETVRVYFDPERVSYEAVAKRFFEIHDPTQTDGQGPDIGPEYLSAVFVTGPEQREVTDALIERLEARGYDVATQVKPSATFWIAEDYHQNYYVKHAKTPYCHTPVDRFGD